MSRIGLAPIALSPKVSVEVDGNVVRVKGPLGELSQEIKNRAIEVKIEGAEIKLECHSADKSAQAAHGLYRQLIANMVSGVEKPFEKKLIVYGVGYKASVQGSRLVLGLGLAHTVELQIPEGIKCEAKEGEDKDKKTLEVRVSGISKEKVGQFAAVVRSKRPVEPYHGYGIHYSDEVVIHKEGKTSGKK